MVTVSQFVSTQRSAWDGFVRNSKTPLFFFERSFMEYHADRFVDSSLIAHQDGDMIAALPASLHGETLVSHGGLTFGGLLTARTSRSGTTAEALSGIIDYLRASGITTLRYKVIPHIFHVQPAEEDQYFLINRFRAQLVRRDVSSVIDLSDRLKLSKGRKALISRARQSQVEIERSEDWAGFHALLCQVLSRHDASPVHSAAELEMLGSAFPDRMQLHLAKLDGELLAGTLLFNFGKVTHTQYMAVSERGKELGALDVLIDQCISSATSHSAYFSFGISTEQNGKYLNEGLLGQKESFGARSIVLDTYEVNVP